MENAPEISEIWMVFLYENLNKEMHVEFDSSAVTCFHNLKKVTMSLTVHTQ